MINQDRLVNTFLELVRIDSPSGQEAEIGRHLAARLQALGFTTEFDETGNLIALLDGTGDDWLLLSAHMDTVGTDTGIEPVIRDGVIYSVGNTILGGDDKSGVAAILEVLQTLREQDLAHPPLEVVISVGEELGLYGAASPGHGQAALSPGCSPGCGRPRRPPGGLGARSGQLGVHRTRCQFTCRCRAGARHQRDPRRRGSHRRHAAGPHRLRDHVEYRHHRGRHSAQHRARPGAGGRRGAQPRPAEAGEVDPVDPRRLHQRRRAIQHHRRLQRDAGLRRLPAVGARLLSCS